MDKLRITELFIENVGPFEYQHFIFPEKKNDSKAEIHLITGENGTGKTTLLLMLSSLNENYHVRKRFLFPNETSSYTIKFSNSQEYTVTPKSGSGRMAYNKMPKFLSEYNQKTELRGSTFDFAFFAYSGSRNLSSGNLKSIQELTDNPFENALNFGSSTNTQNLIQWIANLKTKEALALVKNEKSRASIYSSSISRIENSISKIIDKKLKFILEDDPLNVVIQIDNKFLSFDLLPDGLKAIISWISDLLMRLDRIKWTKEIDPLDRNFILFLDEIDVHLHPAWQRKILPVIQDLFTNAQIFISTHSPFVVGSVDGAWIHRISLSKNSAKNDEPLLSEDSKSYNLVLKEIFNIHSFFGIELEKKLEEFREVRNKIIHKGPDDNSLNQLKTLLKYFKEQESIELENMIGMEILQLKRILNNDNLLND